MNKRYKLITETSHDIALVEKHLSDTEKELYIEGVFSTAESKNQNKRKYRKSTLLRESNKLQEKMANGTLWGELDHPPQASINLDRIAIKVESLHWNGNDLMGRAKVLDTPQGIIAKTLIREGKLGISSRGLGTVNDDGYVDESFNLITFDLVGDPSNQSSWMNGIYESACFDETGKVMQDIDDELIGMSEAKEEFGKYIKSIVESIKKEL